MNHSEPAAMKEFTDLRAKHKQSKKAHPATPMLPRRPVNNSTSASININKTRR